MESRTISKFGQVRVSCLERVKKNPHRLTSGKRCSHLFSPVYDPILMILAGSEDMHKRLDEFEFGQDLTTGCRVTCSCP